MAGDLFPIDARNVANPLLARLAANTLGTSSDEGARALLGLFLLWGEPGIAELCGTLPVDFVVIDMEAGALGRPEVLRMTQALTGSPVSVLVRVPSHDQHAIEHALDIGAHGVMVPKVNTADEARAVAAATRFPPDGRRGVNPVRASRYFADLPGFFADANGSVLCLAQIETPAAVDNSEEIAAVPGIDGLFLGMGDLAMALGQPGDVTGVRMDRARARVLAAAGRHRKMSGAFAYGLDLARSYSDEGFDFLGVGNDVKIMRDGIARTVASIRADLPGT